MYLNVAALALIKFDVEGSAMLTDDSSNTITFNVSVINKGQTIASMAEDHFGFQLYLSDSDSVNGNLSVSKSVATAVMPLALDQRPVAT